MNGVRAFILAAVAWLALSPAALAQPAPSAGAALLIGQFSYKTAGTASFSLSETTALQAELESSQ